MGGVECVYVHTWNNFDTFDLLLVPVFKIDVEKIEIKKKEKKLTKIGQPFPYKFVLLIHVDFSILFIHFLQNKDLPITNTTDVLSTMALICRCMIENR